MTLKQLLKPDWRKIVIVLIIAIFNFSLIFYWNWFGSKFPVIIEFLYSYLNNPFFIMTSIWGNTIFTGYGMITYFILDLIYWYLLSCLVVWIYDRFRVKKK